MSTIPASNKPVRIGVIGAGRFGRHYIRLLQHTPGAELAAVASTKAETATLVPQGCNIVSDWRDLMDAALLDGVVIATPPALHVPMALEALKARIAALVEKPVALSSADAAQLRDAAAKGGIVHVNHIQVINPAWRALKKQLPRIGAVRKVVSEGCNEGPYRSDTPPLWDYGAHDMSLVLDLFNGQPDTLTARLLERKPVKGAYDAMLAETELVFGNVTARLRFGNISAVKIRRMEVVGERGTLLLDDLAAQKLQFITASGTAEPLPYDPLSPLETVIQRFERAIHIGRNDINDLALGFAVVQQLERLDVALGLNLRENTIS